MRQVDLCVSAFPLHAHAMERMRAWLIDASASLVGPLDHDGIALVDAAMHVLAAAAAFGPPGRLVTLAVAAEDGAASIRMAPGGGPGGQVVLRQARSRSPQAPPPGSRRCTPVGAWGWRPQRAEA